MICKNCQYPLPSKAKYCQECGANVVLERITARHLLEDLYTHALGWDNKFFVTIRYLIAQPGVLLSAYLDGTRKKFTNPFSFFAIGAAISLLVISQFPAQFAAMNNLPEAMADSGQAQQVEGQPDAPTFNPGTATFQQSLMQNWNVFSFLFLPIYTLIAWWVFGGPYNLGEHLVINAYIQGITFLLMTILFLVSLVGGAIFYQLSYFLMVLYYSYSYARLYQHSFGKAMLKLLKFVGIMLLFFVGAVAIGILLRFMSA